MTERPRVLMYSVTFPSEAGGVQAVIFRLSEALEAGGFDVRRGWSTPGGPRGDGVWPLAWVRRRKRVPTPGSLWRAAGSLSRLAAALRRHRPAIVNFHYIGARTIYFLLLRPVFGYKLVATVHGSDVLRPENRDRGCLGYVLRKADAVTVVSQHAADRVLSHAGVDAAKVHIIPNGIDLGFWSEGVDGAGEQGGSEGPTILAVGRLHEVKGQDVLIAAMPRILASVPKARLVLAGDGPNRQPLAEQVGALGLGEAVAFIGEVDAAAVRAWFAAADVVVVPSRSEGTPLALLEAMASETAVVASEVGGIPDVVGSDAAVLVEPEAPEALADAVIALLRDPARRRRLADRGRARVEHWCESTAHRRYAEVFRGLIGHDESA